ncbi:MAG: hypothetical protein ACXWIU_11050 [Limisphaerales bacterium]
MTAAVPVALGVAFLAAGPQAARADVVAPGCQIPGANGAIKHVVQLMFDNVHLRRDNPNVPSDLELMPNLLNFMLNNGTVSGTHYTPLISHTATDILTAQTGVYGDRMGVPVSNSYGFFNPNGSVGFSSSFLYWTATAADGKPQMINELGKTAPAPWVAFTRAGCDVGGFSVANIEFESVPADVNTVFGANSPEGIEANNAAIRDKANADFLGIAIHCALNSPLCNNAHARPDLLPDEPGGYAGFNALFGNIHTQPVISPSGPVKDLDGNIIQTAQGNPGFPNIFNPTATQSLGYAAQMMEAGVPVVYVYIADAHDNRTASGTFGPGEAQYVAQLQQYDVAFGKFFARLAAAGIDKTNTLFVITADENDHFVGGTPTPANCDGVTVPCTYGVNQKGEITANLNRLLFQQRNNTTPFSVHSDDAPTMHIVGNPAPTDPVVRTMVRDLDALAVPSPITGLTEKLSELLADPAEMKLLHMVTASSARTPTLTMFGNENYFFQTIGQATTGCVPLSGCIFVNPAFAWNHGDFQQDITRGWFGMVGPGVQKQGRNDTTFSDHTDLRPTMMRVLGLTDDYVHDGRVLIEKLDSSTLPANLKSSAALYRALGDIHKQLTAPLGSVGMNSLFYANKNIVKDDASYATYLTTITTFTNNRNALDAQIVSLLNGAAFQGQTITSAQALPLITQARAMISQMQSLASAP